MENPNNCVGVREKTIEEDPDVRVKNRGPFVPFLISFSDDESGSDPDPNPDPVPDQMDRNQNNTKLQHLRRLIAIRENQLKLKASIRDAASHSQQQNKRQKMNNATDSMKTLSSSTQAANKPPIRQDMVKHTSELSNHGGLPLLRGKLTPRPFGSDFSEKCGDNQVRSVRMAQKPTPDVNNVDSSIQVAGGNHGNHTAFSDLPIFSKCYDKLNVGRSSNLDLQSLTDFEESEDKELEEAQEYRRKCEIEERSALKAYRKAQRALLEANARCSYLYNRREQYSAHLRHLMFGNPNLFLSSGTHEETGIRLNSLTSTLDGDVYRGPTSSCAVQPPPFNNQQGCNSTIHPDEGAFQNVCSTQIKLQNMANDPFSEPDGSTSERYKEEYDPNGVCCASEDFNVSQDEDEGALQYEHDSQENISDYQENSKVSIEGKKMANVDAENSSKLQGKGKTCVDKENNEKTGSGPLSMDSSQDSLLREASLRSQLFERLKMRTLSQTVGRSESVEPLAEGTVGDNDFSGRVGMTMGNTQFSDTDSENKMQKGDKISHLACSATFSYPILRSVFSYFDIADSKNLLKSQTGDRNIQTSHYCEEENVVSANVPSISNLNLVEEASGDCFGSQSGSYSCNIAIDPLWPLCIYEIRGKCNNDECSWQHLRDHPSDNRMKSNLDSEDNVGSQSQGQKCSATRTLSKSLDCLTLPPPNYLVGLDVLKADLQSSKSILMNNSAQQVSKFLSLSFVLSNQLPSDLLSNEACFHGADARIEVHGGWNRRSLYFHSRNKAPGPGEEPYADDDQSVELALLFLSQEANRSKGRVQALPVLARALEANPTSAVLWIIYLLIYYCSENSIGKDDIFRCAVDHYEGSYELWLLYINSRVQLEDRLAAYEAALLALCRHASASATETTCTSECILDIFLQMMDCLCMSGNIGKAIEIIYGLYPTTRKCDNGLKLFLPDIIKCLAISDKCVFWISCVYLVVYKKLPDAIVQRFEFQKDLSSIIWPSAELTVNEKQQGVSLMEFAVDSLALYIDRESLEDEANLRAAHLFSVNHVRSVAVLEGFECSKNLLERYVKLYPSCLELVLMFARVEHDCASGSFEGYEEALDNWLDEVPGIQCIWNQYVQCALQHGVRDYAKELMARWFSSSWNIGASQSKMPEAVDGENLDCSLQSASVSDVLGSLSNCSQSDTVFGLLNFSICKLLQNDHSEAQLAIDRALEVATAGNYNHCVREKLLFMTATGLQENGPLKLLCGYLSDYQASLPLEPLSRRFIQRIKKPRVQQLVGKLLCPVSLDPSLVNSVLEALHGPSYLPQGRDKLLQFTNVVEILMEIIPSNYFLAISLCKQFIRNSNAADISGSLSFWASSLLSNSVFQAVPVAPEYIWVEAAGILHDLADSQTICTTFVKRALFIYPFSMMLWKIYLNMSKAEGNKECVIKEAGLKGINLKDLST